MSRIQIENFRTFHRLDVSVGQHLVIVGENKIGKSNLLHALRLVLDPELPDSARNLVADDFWDGLKAAGSPVARGEKIKISVDLTDFEGNNNILSVLAEHVIQANPLVARLTYLFRPRLDLGEPPKKESDYEFVVYGGDREDCTFGYELRKRLPMTVLQALRDAEGDLESWRRSPLRPLLDKAAGSIERSKLETVASQVTTAANAVSQLNEIKDLSKLIAKRMRDMVGSQALQTSFGFTPTDPDRLIRELRLMIDQGQRGVGRASLGSANLLYITLKVLEYEELVEEGKRDHTFLAIEEPEAHLHPHLQRLVYRDLLQKRSHLAGNSSRDSRAPQTLLLTTHSPHIASVAPVRSLLLLRKAAGKASTEAVSTAKVSLDQKDEADLERYLDVTRGEMLFARGVLLVEGEAEEYVVPVLGRELGYDFDALGITVCNIRGTNFEPYVKFLGPQGLGIPFAVITDFDPQEDGTNLGEKRVKKILKHLMEPSAHAKLSVRGVASEASKYGVFLNQYTFEVDLFRSGRHKSMCTTISELTTVAAARGRAASWKADLKKMTPTQFLKDIEKIGKGRFAQRLASRISGRACPSYIQEAIKYVAAKCEPR
ncbi:MAG: ATP-dependent nuclease [Bacillota bacterium]